ncbi:MAG: ATP-binding protein [Thermodesulfobacteriota bacterium]
MKHDMERINTAAAHMDELLDCLLEASRIGRMAVLSEVFSPGDVVADAIKRLALQIEQGRVAVDITSALPTITADRQRMVELFGNLLENAVKFMGEQKNPRIEVSMREKDGETVICVSDNGMGIDDRYHGTIFNLYEQLDPESDGSGIGLAVVKRIVELHRGRVWVESEGEV